jgi:hypothetical protein
MPEDISDKMSQNIPNRMSEDMPDKMPIGWYARRYVR